MKADYANHAIASSLDELLNWRSRLRRVPRLVDNVQDRTAAAAERHGHHVPQSDTGSDRYLEGVIRDHCGVSVEEAVTPKSPRFVAHDCGIDSIGGESTHCAAHPLGLIGHVVRHLVLEHVSAPAVAVPLHLMLLVVLNEEAVHRHFVSVHDQAVRRGVGGPTHAVAVIGAPEPEMVADHVVAVDLE